MPINPADILFSPATRAVQKRYGSRDYIARLETRGHWRSRLSEDVISFIRTRNSFYLGTASREGRPYIQHRGGPPGFISILDQETLAWPKLQGNRQHITAGNLSGNNQAFIFLMDYSLPRRIKLWGRAEVIYAPAPITQKWNALYGSPWKPGMRVAGSISPPFQQRRN